MILESSKTKKRSNHTSRKKAYLRKKSKTSSTPGMSYKKKEKSMLERYFSKTYFKLHLKLWIYFLLKILKTGKMIQGFYNTELQLLKQSELLSLAYLILKNLYQFLLIWVKLISIKVFCQNIIQSLHKLWKIHLKLP